MVFLTLKLKLKFWCTHGKKTKVPWPGFEPGFSRPQREVLTTILSWLDGNPVNKILCKLLLSTWISLSLHCYCCSVFVLFLISFLNFLLVFWIRMHIARTLFFVASTFELYNEYCNLMCVDFFRENQYDIIN